MPPRRANSELPKVGVIMLNTAFRRPVGDIGNNETFGGNVVYDVVAAATVARVLGAPGQDAGLAKDFLAARDRLVTLGAEMMTTSCGELVFYQDLLQVGCSVPVVASALFQVARRGAELDQGRRVGIICMDARSLSAAHLAAAGCPAETPVVGLEEGAEIYPVLKANDPTVTLDPARAEADVIRAGRKLMADHSEIGAIVFECANLPPYRAALERAVGVPVFDILTWLEEVWRKTGPSMASVHVHRAI